MDAETSDAVADDQPEQRVPDVAPGRRESKLPTYLVLAASVLTVLATVTTWVRVQALDTDEWVELSSELLDDDEIRYAIADHLVDSLYANADLAADLETGLPLDLGRLAGLLAEALREPLTNSIDNVLASNVVDEIWAEANRSAHSAAVAILRDEVGGAVSTTDGVIALELGEVLRDAAERAGLSGDLLDGLPPDAGRIVIVESDELESAQTVVRLLDIMSWFLFIVVIGLYVAAVAIAGARRMQVLRMVGIGLLVAGVVELFVRAIGIRVVVNAIVADPANESVANQTSYVLTRLLGQIAWTLVLLGGAIALFAWLLGPGRRAVAARKAIAPVVGSPPVMIASTALVALLLLWWSPGRLFESWLSAIVVFALLIGGAVVLHSAVTAESADAQTAD